jgi:hypothetical protein
MSGVVPDIPAERASTAPDRPVLITPIALVATLVVALVGAACGLPERLRFVNLGCAFILVYVLPGLLLARMLLPADRWWPEILSVSFGLSLASCLVAAIVMVEMHIPMTTMSWLWVAATAAGIVAYSLHWLSRRRATQESSSPGESEWPILKISGLALLVVVVVACYLIGGTYSSLGGEEGYHVGFVRKMFSNPRPSPHNLFYLPGTSSTYIYLPYHFSLALLCKLSGTDPITAFIKFRPFAAIVTLLTMAALVARAAGSRVAGWSALNLLCILVLTNDAGYRLPYFAQLVPVSHHSDVSLGMGLAMGDYFFWRAVTAARRLGMEFWLGSVVGVTILFCHVREGLQLLIYGLVLVVTALLFCRGNRNLVIHGLVYCGVLIAAGKVYQHLQGLRATHLVGWEEAEKAVAVDLLRSTWSSVKGGNLLPLFGPRADVASTYMPYFNLCFSSFYGLTLLIAPLVLLKARRIWAFFIPVLIAAILLMTLLPPISYAAVVLGYSQILYTPLRFILHWELVLFSISVYLILGWATDAAMRRAGLSALVLAGCSVIAGGGVAYGASLADRMAVEQTVLAPWFVLTGLLVACMYRLIVRYRSAGEEGGEKGSALPSSRHSVTFSVIFLAFCLPFLLRSYPPSLRDQVVTALARPSGLNVLKWTHEMNLMNLPGPTQEFIHSRLPRGKVLAYDPRYIFSIPTVFDQYIFTFGCYYSSERPFFDRFYDIRRRTAPFRPQFSKMFQYVDAYVRDVMLAFPLYNWQDPLDVTLMDCWGNVDYVVVSPEFATLWRTSEGYFPRAFVRVHEHDGYAIYRVETSGIADALRDISANPLLWLERDVERGYPVRALFSLDRWKEALGKERLERGLTSVSRRLPPAVLRLVPKGSAEQTVTWLLGKTCFVPAQKHYDVRVDLRSLLMEDGTHVSPGQAASQHVPVVIGPGRSRVFLPVFLPKNRQYHAEISYAGQAQMQARVGDASVPHSVSEASDKDRKMAFLMPGNGLHVLELRASPSNPETSAVIKDIRIVEDLQWAAVRVDLPARQ